MSTLFFAAAIVGALFACETVENVKSKDEYGILQVVEYENRRSPISGVEIVEKNGYWVAGFRAVSGDGNVWVLLNARYSPYYKQVPEEPFKVSQQSLDAVRRTLHVSKEVLEVLESRTSSESSRSEFEAVRCPRPLPRTSFSWN